MWKRNQNKAITVQYLQSVATNNQHSTKKITLDKDTWKEIL